VFIYDLIREKTISYAEHGFVGDWNKFSSCEAELLGSHDADDDEGLLKRNRGPHPIAFPDCISYTVCLKEKIQIYKNFVLHNLKINDKILGFRRLEISHFRLLGYDTIL
jgi:hypothetical protein